MCYIPEALSKLFNLYIIHTICGSAFLTREKNDRSSREFSDQYQNNKDFKIRFCESKRKPVYVFCLLSWFQATYQDFGSQ